MVTRRRVPGRRPAGLPLWPGLKAVALGTATGLIYSQGLASSGHPSAPQRGWLATGRRLLNCQTVESGGDDVEGCRYQRLRAPATNLQDLPWTLGLAAHTER